jgi:lipoprotein-anchoring transpeptidase ErfK/SrfK
MNPPTSCSLTTLALALALSSCTPVATYRVPAETAFPPPETAPVLYEWFDDAGPGPVSIRIDRTTQRATFQRGGRWIGWSYVATGKPSHPTPAGTFRITEKIADKHSNRYGWIEDAAGNIVDGDAKYNDHVPPGCRYRPAPMPNWMRLTSYGIGMHAGTIPDPGHPASHGCIRLPKQFAPILFNAVNTGTRVTID